MKKPTLLYIETSGAYCSIAISYGDSLVSLQESKETFAHASEITLLIEQAMQDVNKSWVDISAVVVCDGPGSYTGLRVGLSTAKGLCYSLGIPMIAVNALEAMGQFFHTKYQGVYLFPMIDARRMEVYMAGYDENLQEIRSIKATILTENTFEKELSDGKKILLCGSGVAKAKTLFTTEFFIFEPTRFSSKHLIGLGFAAFRRKDFVDVAGHTPFYLKPPNITMPKKK